MARGNVRRLGARLVERATQKGLELFNQRRRARIGWLYGALDVPRALQPFHDWIIVRGWCCVEDGAPVTVVLSAAGKQVEALAPSLPRPDVAKLYPHVPGVERSGFEVFVKAFDLPSSRVVFLKCAARAVQNGQTKEATLETVPVVRWRPGRSMLPRFAYQDVWDRSARNFHDARVSVAGYDDDEEWNRTGELFASDLTRATGIGPRDVVLEIGCGAGRVGAKLAPRCQQWIGADVSPNMLRYAREALEGSDNVSFVQLNGVDLHGIRDESIDVVYCTVVFMHLDEWDRYRYVAEAHRVLRPGGRLYVDNFGLSGEMGWKLFLETSQVDAALRPPNVSKSSTGEELQIYAERAGFTDIVIERTPMFVAMVARKPGATTEERRPAS
ncbi:MAG: methyltransferase domain-containing protein [Luteitalea sp.]|nr:methyltransferase domain-containing protein [Luteitalea sp.]